MRLIQPSVAATSRHPKPSAVHSSGMVNSMVSITVTGDHDRPEWLIRINGIRTLASELRVHLAQIVPLNVVRVVILPLSKPRHKAP